MNRTHECIVIIELRLSVLFPNFVRWMTGLNLVDQGYEVNDWLRSYARYDWSRIYH